MSYFKMEDVMSLLGIENPSGRNSFNILCPVCGTKTKKLNINLGKQVWNCPKCSTGGGVIAFYGFMRHGIDPETLKDNANLKSRLLSEMRSSGCSSSSYEAYRSQKKVEETITAPMAKINTRDKVYRAFLDALTLEKEDYDNLISRGLTEDQIKKYGYKSVQNIDLSTIPDFNPKGVPGFYLDENGKWQVRNYGKGFYIPVRNLSGKIQGCQIRLRSGNMRYLWLSTPEHKNGAGAETWAHFVGFPEETILITEGPLKADIIHAFTGQPVIAVPGVNSLSHMEKMIKGIKKYGVSKVLTCFDMDYRTNENVRKAYAKLIKILRNEGMSPKRLIWNENFKGYDDYLLSKIQK